MSFSLHPTLEADSDFVTDLTLCQVRLIKNAAFPWILLIPRQENIVEVLDLSPADQEVLWNETRQALRIMGALFSPTKLNVANLGNVVAQFHMHVIARYNTDKAWPGPVWNSGVKQAYEDAAKKEHVATIRAAFEADGRK